MGCLSAVKDALQISKYRADIARIDGFYPIFQFDAVLPAGRKLIFFVNVVGEVRPPGVVFGQIQIIVGACADCFDNLQVLLYFFSPFYRNRIANNASCQSSYMFRYSVGVQWLISLNIRRKADRLEKPEARATSMTERSGSSSRDFA